MFTKLDLVKGYYQVNMNTADIPKTAIITPFGLWEFVVMPFGLRNAGNTFQRMMGRVGAGLDFAFIYLDDILITSSTMEEHLVHLQQVFERLSDFGLVINPAKCAFGRSSIEFLGHAVSAAGFAPLTKHLDAISSFPAPADRQQLQRFLGMVNFYFLLLRRQGSGSVDRWAQGPSLRLPLDPRHAVLLCLRQSPLGPGSWVVSSHRQRRPLHRHLRHASATHVGAALQQWSSLGAGGAWQPLAFFSKKLADTETRYSTFDHELLAAYLAIRHFRFALEGRQFCLLTDHKPLCAALRRVSPPWSACQPRHLSYLAEFTDNIRFLPGDLNPVADCLSRPLRLGLRLCPWRTCPSTSLFFLLSSCRVTRWLPGSRSRRLDPSAFCAIFRLATQGSLSLRTSAGGSSTQSTASLIQAAAPPRP